MTDRQHRARRAQSTETGTRSPEAAPQRAAEREAGARLGGGTWALHTPRWLRKHPRAAEPPGCGPSPARGRPVTFAPGSAPESSRGASTSGAGGGGKEGGGRSASAARRLLPFLEGRGPRRGGRCPARPPLPAPPAVPVPAAPRLRQAGGLARACHFLPRREGGGGLGRGAPGRRGGGCGEVLPGQPTPPPGPPPPRARPRAGPSLPAGARCHSDAAPGPPRSRPEWFGFFFFPSPWLWFSFSSFLPPLLSLRIPLAV